jgi:hypothetical protein
MFVTGGDSVESIRNSVRWFFEKLPPRILLLDHLHDLNEGLPYDEMRVIAEMYEGEMEKLAPLRLIVEFRADLKENIENAYRDRNFSGYVGGFVRGGVVNLMFSDENEMLFMKMRLA